jgi:ribokinase
VAKVVVLGSINMDVVARAGRHPAVGETVLGTSLAFVPGGKGANQAVAASRLAAPTELVGRVGSDAFAGLVLDFLSAEKVGSRGVRRLRHVATGTALIVVDDAGDNTIVVLRGANHQVTVADAYALPLERHDVLVLQYELPLEVVHAALSRARAIGARSILNPAPAQASPPEMLALADFLVVNEVELSFFVPASGSGAGLDLAARLRRFRQRPDQVVIATLGAGGVAALIGTEVVSIPGRVVPVVDTTGAGDCFVGALAAALCSWVEVVEAIHFANLAASIAVQRPGAGPGMPFLAEIEALT